MKFGFTIAIAIIALFSSCSSQEEKVTLTSPQMSDVKIIRSYDDALKIAEASISLLNGSDVTTRSGSPRVIDMDKSKVFKNTANAQVMSYYEYPSAIDLTYPGCGQTYQTLNWTSMKSPSFL